MRYPEFYERLSGPFRGRPGRIKALKWLDRGLALVFYLGYPLLLAGLLLTRGLRDPLFFKCLLVPAAGFAAETVLRAAIGRKRPYETYAGQSFRPLLMKDTKGHSMPSRHVFSSAVIAMTFFQVFPPAGLLLLLLSAVIAGVRVLGGVHYPSDVAAGFGLGVAAGLLYWIL